MANIIIDERDIINTKGDLLSHDGTNRVRVPAVAAQYLYGDSSSSSGLSYGGLRNNGGVVEVLNIEGNIWVPLLWTL